MLSEVDFRGLQLDPNVQQYGYDIDVRMNGAPLGNYLSGKLDPRWRPNQRHNRKLLQWLREEIVDNPRNFTSLHVLAHDEVSHNGCEIDWKAWARPDLPLTADFAHVWDQFGLTCMAVGDGAKMILHPDELPAKIKDICAAQLTNGSTVHGPDLLWQAFASNYFHAVAMPTVPNFATLISSFNSLPREDITTAQNVVEGHLVRHGLKEYQNLLIKMFYSLNRNLNIFYQMLFGEQVANEGPLAILPSGVMAIGILSPDHEFYYAWTGDVDVFSVTSEGLAYRLSYEDVGNHDYVSRMFAGYDRADREAMIRFAENRIFEVGNLNGRSKVKIQFGHFTVPIGGGVIMSTDGKRMTYLPKPGDMKQRRGIPTKPADIDIAATLNWRDADIAQVDTMHLQRNYRQALAKHSISPDFRMIPDDATLLKLKRLE